MTESRYFLPDDYVARNEPEYFVDDNLNAVWQPDVYPEAAAVGRRLGAQRIIDLGCGTAGKLVALHPEFEIVGIDFGSNIEACRERYDFGTWMAVDLDRDETLDIDFAGAVLVCADVIEHVLHPERLLGLLKTAREGGASCLLLSTPERELYNEPGHLGPPPNAAHVREWTRAELEQLLASHGLRGHIGLTRSNDVMPYMQTILAVTPGTASEHREIVAEWWDERRKWEQLAVEHDRLLGEKEQVIQDFVDVKAWLEEQRAAWQRTAEEALQAQALAQEQLAVITESATVDEKPAT